MVRDRIYHSLHTDHGDPRKAGSTSRTCGRVERTDPSADPLNDPSREQKQEDRRRGLQASDDPHRFRCMRGTAHRILRNQSSSGNLKDVRLIMY